MYRRLNERILPKPFAIHFILKPKPWKVKRTEWADLGIYWQVVADMIRAHPTLKDSFSAEYKKSPERICPYCATLETMLGSDAGSVPNGHLFIKNGVIKCPRIN